MRETCWRCRRPLTACWCEQVPALRSRTEVVFLQHPRERHVPIGTARMAHLGLVDSRLLEGLHFDDDPRLQDLFDVDSGAAILFPGDNAIPLPAWTTPPKKLVVLDGTWSQASKLLSLNPRLASLPRMSFQPEQPGRYRSPQRAHRPASVDHRSHRRRARRPRRRRRRLPGVVASL